MCVDKKEFEALGEAVKAVKHDTGNIRNGLQSVHEQLKHINGRVGKAEKKVEQLEDPRIRIAECIQKDTITEIKEKMLTVDRFEAYLQDLKDEARRAEDIAIQEAVLVKGEEGNKLNQIKVWLIVIGTLLTGLHVYSQLT